jgi:hypothetical protein
MLLPSTRSLFVPIASANARQDAFRIVPNGRRLPWLETAAATVGFQYLHLVCFPPIHSALRPAIAEPRFARVGQRDWPLLDG